MCGYVLAMPAGRSSTSWRWSGGRAAGDRAGLVASARAVLFAFSRDPHLAELWRHRRAADRHAADWGADGRPAVCRWHGPAAGGGLWWQFWSNFGHTARVQRPTIHSPRPFVHQPAPALGPHAA